MMSSAGGKMIGLTAGVAAESPVNRRQERGIATCIAEESITRRMEFSKIFRVLDRGSGACCSPPGIDLQRRVHFSTAAMTFC